MTIENRTYRINSIDFLKGIVMVVMALDHTRDYFHWSANVYDPGDPLKTNLPIFFTRWITHFCAPVFSFLAGISAFLQGRRKTLNEQSSFLFKRGLWLVIMEITIVNFGWYFDYKFRSPTLAVIWVLGISMISLAALIHLPRKILLVFSCIVIFGHDLFDSNHDPGYLWAFLHLGGFYEYQNGYHLSIVYPIVPWIAVMSLGYFFGSFYNQTYDSSERRKYFNLIGILAIIGFVLVRWINHYGDPFGWKQYGDFSKNLISFMNPNKYPPSVQYLLMTLGPAFIFLANTENIKGKIVEFFSVFGRVPFFYYILHIYLIHFLTFFAAEISGYGWQSMLLPDWPAFIPALKGYGFGLEVVYAVWISVIALLYFVCKKFDNYKARNKQKWWLGYL